LERAGFQIRRNTLGHRLRREEILGEVRDAQAILAGVEPYDAKLLKTIPHLACISRCGTGTDSIDLAAAREGKISILTTPDEVVPAVAEITVAMILGLARNLAVHLADLKQGTWRKITGHLLSEWTIGLVGFGRIGRAVAQLLLPFGPTFLAADPKANPCQIPEGVELTTLSQLLSRSDLVSLHAGRDPKAGPILGRKEIFAMKPGARLVNTARGFLVDETALTEALQSGQLSAAAVDVFETEPYAGPLTRLPQVILTPHVSSLTRASRAAMELKCAQNVVNFFSAQNRSSPALRREDIAAH